MASKSEAKKETWIKVFPIDTNQRAKIALAALRIPKNVITHVDWNDISRYWYMPAKKAMEVITRLPKDTKAKAVKILWEKVGEGYANEGIIAKKFKIATKEGARYGYLSTSNVNAGGEEVPLAFLNVTANRSLYPTRGIFLVAERENPSLDMKYLPGWTPINDGTGVYTFKKYNEFMFVDYKTRNGYPIYESEYLSLKKALSISQSEFDRLKAQVINLRKPIKLENLPTSQSILPEHVTTNRAGQKHGYTDLSAVGFYPTRSDREGDHFTTRKPAYKGIKITAGYDSYYIYHSKPFTYSLTSGEIFASVKARGFTKDQYFADAEKHPLAAKLDPREKTTTVESIKAAVERIAKNNEYMAKKYGTGSNQSIFPDVRPPHHWKWAQHGMVLESDDGRSRITSIHQTDGYELQWQSPHGESALMIDTHDMKTAKQQMVKTAIMISKSPEQLQTIMVKRKRLRADKDIEYFKMRKITSVDDAKDWIKQYADIETDDDDDEDEEDTDDAIQNELDSLGFKGLESMIGIYDVEHEEWDVPDTIPDSPFDKDGKPLPGWAKKKVPVIVIIDVVKTTSPVEAYVKGDGKYGLVSINEYKRA